MKPLNNHVLIEPIANKSFIITQQKSYQEIGIVISTAEGINLPLGCQVYFDSWLAKKFPTTDGKFIWFVDYADIVAYDNAPLSE